jgi:hypothetical protein
MSEQVHTVTDLPVKSSTLKKFAKRGVIAAVAVGTLAALYLRSQNSNEESNTETSKA